MDQRHGAADDAERGKSMTLETTDKTASFGVEGTLGVERRLLTVEDGTICVYEAGKEHKRTIVLLHGAMYDESRFIWMRCFLR